MLLSEAGHSATVLVAFATIGGIPRPMSAGKVSNVPPPAIAFMTPLTVARITTTASRAL
jgi:hypothetical protein